MLAWVEVRDSPVIVGLATKYVPIVLNMPANEWPTHHHAENAVSHRTVTNVQRCIDLQQNRIEFIQTYHKLPKLHFRAESVTDPLPSSRGLFVYLPF